MRATNEPEGRKGKSKREMPSSHSTRLQPLDPTYFNSFPLLRLNNLRLYYIHIHALLFQMSVLVVDKARTHINANFLKYDTHVLLFGLSFYRTRYLMRSDFSEADLMSIAHIMCQKNSRSSISSGLFLRIARNLYESTGGRYSQPSFHPRIHTLSPLLRATITGLQNFRCLALKYLWRYILTLASFPALCAVLPLSLSQSSWLFVLRILLLLVLALSLRSLFHLYSRSYYSCEKAAGVNLKSSLRGGREVQKMGEVSPFLRALFFDLFPRSGYRCWHLRLIFIRYLDSRLLVA